MAKIKIVRFEIVLAVALFSTLVADGWINDWDGWLEYQCSFANQSISQFISKHNSHREDRRYRMGCRSLPGNVQYFLTRCHWTEYLNDFDERLDFNCGRNGYINGMESYHRNRQEDRKWKIRCCEVPGLFLVNCSTTWYTNYYDEYQSYTVPSGRVLSGVYSIHNNHHEDRRWKFRTCNVRDGIFD